MSPTPAHPIPDRHGVNLFTSDPTLRELLPLYLPADLVEHLLPHLTRLGALAGGVLDEAGAGPQAGVEAVQLF